MRVHLVAFVVVSLVSTPSHADPRYSRRSAVPPPPTFAKRTERYNPDRGQPPRPTVTADAVLAAEQRNQPIRIEQEQLLEKLVRDTPDSDPDKPDLMFRLAELYAQQLRFWRIKAGP